MIYRDVLKQAKDKVRVARGLLEAAAEEFMDDDFGNACLNGAERRLVVAQELLAELWDELEEPKEIFFWMMNMMDLYYFPSMWFEGGEFVRSRY